MDHASEIIALDTEKFKIAKKNSDLEIGGERLEQELLQTKGAIDECEAGLGRKGHGHGQVQGLSGSISGLEDQDQVLLVLFLSFSLFLVLSLVGVHANLSSMTDSNWQSIGPLESSFEQTFPVERLEKPSSRSHRMKLRWLFITTAARNTSVQNIPGVVSKDLERHIPNCNLSLGFDFYSYYRLDSKVL